MYYEKGEKIKDINELLDILREGKAYYFDEALVSNGAYYFDINVGRDITFVNHAIPKKEKKKYYKAWYKLEDNYTLEVPPLYFESLEDFKLWLGAGSNTRDCKLYGLTDEFIEV